MILIDKKNENIGYLILKDEDIPATFEQHIFFINKTILPLFKEVNSLKNKDIRKQYLRELNHLGLNFDQALLDFLKKIYKLPTI